MCGSGRVQVGNSDTGEEELTPPDHGLTKNAPIPKAVGPTNSNGLYINKSRVGAKQTADRRTFTTGRKPPACSKHHGDAKSTVRTKHAVSSQIHIECEAWAEIHPVPPTDDQNSSKGDHLQAKSKKLKTRIMTIKRRRESTKKHAY